MIKELGTKPFDNSFIIIDEIHNLISSMIEPKVVTKTIQNNMISKKEKKINALCLRLLTKLAHSSCKIFFLTATPIFDNYGQFIELLLNLRPDIDFTNLKRDATEIKKYINLLKGKISFYKLDDVSAYPSVKTDNILINMSDSQYEVISNIKGNKKETEEPEDDDYDDDNETSNMFCITERQKAISLYDKSKKKLIFSDLKEYAPKLEKLFKLIELPGKHLIYSTFIKYCLELIASYLEENGWNNYIKSGIKNYKTFVLWDASLNDENKQSVKNVLNSKDNIDGKNIRIILGSPSIKEGVSFKHIQHLHQIDPVWNSSAKEQIEGRCVRYKSHEEIAKTDKKLKREVVIHNYILIQPKTLAKTYKTCDYRIYFEIMEKKKKVIKTIEKLLSKVSIDYYLWTNKNVPKNDSKSSIISASSAKKRLEEIVKTRKEKKEKKTSKPMKKECPEGKILNPKTKRCIKEKKENKK